MTHPRAQLSPVTPGPFLPSRPGSFLTSGQAHAGERSNIEIRWTNHESLSVVRRIERENVPPGIVSVTWDGRSKSGLAAAPGGYTVQVVATDSAGNKARAEILTTLEY
ncbi:MAG: hypothetical protein IT186_06550 [Acidobacteria bacterium]|nr:hypothetical protein [Acidobacteriota bacterium]